MRPPRIAVPLLLALACGLTACEPTYSLNDVRRQFPQAAASLGVGPNGGFFLLGIDVMLRPVKLSVDGVDAHVESRGGSDRCSPQSKGDDGRHCAPGWSFPIPPQEPSTRIVLDDGSTQWSFDIPGLTAPRSAALSVATDAQVHRGAVLQLDWTPATDEPDGLGWTFKPDGHDASAWWFESSTHAVGLEWLTVDPSTPLGPGNIAVDGDYQMSTASVRGELPLSVSGTVGELDFHVTVIP